MSQIENLNRKFEVALLGIEQGIGIQIEENSLEIKDIIQKQRNKYIIFTSGFIIVSIIICILLSHIVSRPVIYSNRLMEKLAEKDLTAVSEMEKYDMLYSAASKMTKSLKSIIIESRQILAMIEKVQNQFINEINVMSTRFIDTNNSLDQMKNKYSEMINSISSSENNINEKINQLSDLSSFLTENNNISRSIYNKHVRDINNFNKFTANINGLKQILEKVDVYAVNIGIESSKGDAENRGYKVIADEIRNVLDSGERIVGELTGQDENLKISMKENLGSMKMLYDRLVSNNELLNSLKSKISDLSSDIYSNRNYLTEMSDNTEKVKVIFMESNEWLTDMKNTFIQLADRINRLHTNLSGFKMKDTKMDPSKAESVKDNDDLAVRTVFG